MPTIDLYDTYKIIYCHKLLFLDRVTQTEKEKPRDITNYQCFLGHENFKRFENEKKK